MLFDEGPVFTGFPSDGFKVFAISHRGERRTSIIETFHPPLEALGKSAIRQLARASAADLHVHLPQLNWPPGYQPFCTWLTLSFEAHGYQDGAQLNLGVHADHVTVRLGWDTRPDLFGRFEFMCRHGGLRGLLEALMQQHGFRIRVYASARWPEGSRLTFETSSDIAGSFDDVHRHGVWWEIGKRFPVPESAEQLAAPDFAATAVEIFETLLPLYERAAGSSRSASGASSEPFR